MVGTRTCYLRSGASKLQELHMVPKADVMTYWYLKLELMDSEASCFHLNRGKQAASASMCLANQALQ